MPIYFSVSCCDFGGLGGGGGEQDGEAGLEVVYPRYFAVFVIRDAHGRVAYLYIRRVGSVAGGGEGARRIKSVAHGVQQYVCRGAFPYEIRRELIGESVGAHAYPVGRKRKRESAERFGRGKFNARVLVRVAADAALKRKITLFCLCRRGVYLQRFKLAGQRVFTAEKREHSQKSGKKGDYFFIQSHHRLSDNRKKAAGRHSVMRSVVAA